MKCLKDYYGEYVEYMKEVGWDGAPAKLNTIQRHQVELNHIAKYDIAEMPPFEITFKKLLDTRKLWSLERTKADKLYSPATLNSRVKVINLLMTHVYRIENNFNPAPQMPRFSQKEIKKRGQVLTMDQCRVLIAALEEEASLEKYYLMVTLSLMTGARFCEFSALRWRDFNFIEKTVCYNERQVDGIVSVGRKCGILSEEYPLNDELIEKFLTYRETLERNEEHDLVFPAQGDPAELSQHGYMSRHTLRKVLERVCKRIAIPRVTPHDLRRTLNTELQRRKIPPEYIRSILGHQTEEMTKHYTHFNTEDKKDLLEMIYQSIKTKGD